MSSCARSSARIRARSASALVALALLAGACAALPPPRPEPGLAARGCATSAAGIAFDFEGASQSQCVIDGERRFTVLISPEHAPPINPSAWYAFRYHADPGPPVEVRLSYLEGFHRYRPKLTVDATTTPLEAAVAEDGKSARIALPPGRGRVSGQEVFASARYDALAQRLAPVAAPVQLGSSHDGRPVEALHFGSANAPALIVLLGRAHPPEVSGAVAMEAFLEAIAARFADGTIDPAHYQLLAVPLLNPDGVARGHWRANLGGRDLNRDWGDFTQPETAAVKAWLDRLDPAVRPVAMVDFHSTRTNLFYVQGEEETDAREEAFLAQWLGASFGKLPDYPFTIERRNANPGSGTSKNWFHETYDIPSYTYEVADEADRDAVRAAARHFAAELVGALEVLAVPASESVK